MQLSRIYSNNPEVFGPIDFNCCAKADHLNAVYGQVRRPKDKRRDSHNLGKTTLLHLIDFLMLKGPSTTHFIWKHQERFKGFYFFLEIFLHGEDYVTIKRGVDDPNKISLARHPEGGRDFFQEPDDEWGHVDTSRDEAVRLLDGWLGFGPLKPYEYRKAITYFLRAQGDYADELQLEKFQQSKDRHWKPFVARLFGFDENLVNRKYELDDQISELKARQSLQQSEVQFNEDQLPMVVARITQMVGHVGEIESSIDAFRFDTEERRLIDELVDNIEIEISAINDRLYNLQYDIQQINSSVERKDKFNISEVEQIFSEASVCFPNQLKKSYEDLIAFNRKVTGERNAALRTRKRVLEDERRQMLARKAELDSQREAHLRIIRSTDSFEKFKSLQREVTKQKSQLAYLEEQRKKLEAVSETAKQVREAERNRGRVIDEMKSMISRSNPIISKFCSVFSGHCQKVLGLDGIFYFRVNNSGNFDYSIDLCLQERADVPSSQGDGSSYKKIVCALFDLALLKTYEDMPFFHFVYHDGIFESLDDRKKLALLAVVRDQVRQGKLQYILTLIDSDMPRNADGKRVNFGQDEIILRLHDDGREGRLFRTAEF